MTVKTGYALFAPTREMVKEYKQGELDASSYAKQYVHLMRISYKKNRKIWHKVLRYGIKHNIAFQCYCAPETQFCHRYFLAYLFEKLGAAAGGELPEKGEAIPTPDIKCYLDSHVS